VGVSSKHHGGENARVQYFADKKLLHLSLTEQKAKRETPRGGEETCNHGTKEKMLNV